MSNEPNPRQRELINNLEGIYLVDAGAGTGKTFTLTRRYANILESTEAEPSDILLITFTNNAAGEMKERVINHCDYDALDLQEAPISTFHSLCQRVLRRDGFDAPRLIGLEERLSDSTTLIENEVTEREYFDEFWRSFQDDNPDHESIFHVIRDPGNLLTLMKSLSAKGIFPTVEGWYQNGRSYLEGDFDQFEALFREANRTIPGKSGPKQSALLNRMRSVHKDKLYLEDAPERDDLYGGEADKQLRPELARIAFEADRDQLFEFVHDIYLRYVEFTLERNYLTFSSLVMFAYVLLCERRDVRRRHQHQYLMIDEFQDTSEIQFKLTLLLSRSNNICVVGDWKQSIYSFQYASVKNILDFQARLGQYKQELNRDRERITYPIEPIDRIDLTTNYRSSQPILDFAERSLWQEATRKEDLDQSEIQDRVVHLTADGTTDRTGVEGIVSSDEPGAILDLVQTIVDSPEYEFVDESGDVRTPTFQDIAVLSRTRNFGLELQQEASRYNIPMAYEGGVELFKTNPAILLLAWFRILDDPLSVKGWSVVLERADYTLREIKAMIPETGRTGEEGNGTASVESDRYSDDYNLPDSMTSFHAELERSETVLEIAQRVFDRYDFRGGFVDKIINVLETTYSGQYVSRGDLVQFMENNIETGSIYEVDSALEGDTVTVQTIHAAKGLEYPIVILADMNRDRFPGMSRGFPVIDYLDPVGLRSRKIHRDDDTPFNYDNWRTDLLSRCISGEYDEERRLLYVALTRAKSYLFLSADADRPGSFFEGMTETIPVREINDPEPEAMRAQPSERTELEIDEPACHAPGKVSVHDLMDEDIYEEVEMARGKELGESVHEFAERYLAGQSPAVESPGRQDKKHVQEFLDELEGEKRAEVPCSLPVTVDGRRITINGVVDLIHDRSDDIDVIDYKTDLEPIAESEYRKQLSVYYHAVKGFFNDDRSVSVQLFYTHDARLTEVEPLSIDQLETFLK